MVCPPNAMGSKKYLVPVCAMVRHTAWIVNREVWRKDAEGATDRRLNRQTQSSSHGNLETVVQHSGYIVFKGLFKLGEGANRPDKLKTEKRR